MTTSQPSANPRLVKEADALTDAGYTVDVVGAYWSPWAAAADARLLATRSWRAHIIDWRREASPWLFWKTRVRHRAAKAAVGAPIGRSAVLDAALDRLTPELRRATRRIDADLYVAHNLGALPAALAGAAGRDARVGFDAEDFHSGQYAADDASGARRAAALAERRLIPRCDYVTAASPGIADAYAAICRGGRPPSILNVFPRSARPTQPRAATSSGPLRLYWFSQTIGPSRGLEDAVRALGTVPDGTAELHLRGQWQAGYERQIDSVRTAAGVSAQRIVAHPPADAQELVRLAAEYDVGLALEPGAPANNDIALSNKLFTYLLAGVPIIATATRAHQEIHPEVAGACRLYRPGDGQGFAGALSGWLRDRAALGQARREAWRLGDTRFNWDVEKRRYLDVIAGVLGEPLPSTAVDPTMSVGAAGMARP